MKGFWSAAACSLRFRCGAIPAMLFLCLIAAWPALAENGDGCPAGMFNTGQAQPGTERSGVFIPICAPIHRQEQPAQVVPMYTVDNYFAAAWHTDSSGAWISSGHHRKEGAEQAALAACNNAMGGGCMIAASTANGTIAVARGVEGDLYSATDKSRGGAEGRAKEHCNKQGDSCDILTWMTAKPGRAPVGMGVPEQLEMFPPPGNPRRSYGAVAWVDSTKAGTRPWTADIWVAGGRISASKASADAKANCEADTKAPCTVRLVAADVHLAVAERDGESFVVASGASENLAKARAMKSCTQSKGKCRISIVVYLGHDEAYRLDVLAEGKPYFAAQAWTTGDRPPWQNTVWSVSGAKDTESAKKAALLACQRDSKVECKNAANSFNGNVALLIDENGNIRTMWLSFDQIPADAVKARCAELKVACKLIKVVDSRVPGTERVEVRR